MIFTSIQPWQIVLIVLGVLAAIYLVCFILNMTCFIFFKRSLKKHRKTMSLVLLRKYENINKLFKLLEKLNVDISEETKKSFSDFNTELLKYPGTKECKEGNDKLTFLRDEALFIARSNSNLEKNNEFIDAKNAVKEMDSVYRYNVSLYNADVLGYNYWIRFLPFRYLFLLFKVQKEDII